MHRPLRHLVETIFSSDDFSAVVDDLLQPANIIARLKSSAAFIDLLQSDRTLVTSVCTGLVN